MRQEEPISAAKAGVNSRRLKEDSKMLTYEEYSAIVNIRSEKLSKLVPDERYWVILERWIKDSCQKVWTKVRYIGETGYNNSLLTFERELRTFSNDKIGYKVTFQKHDFLTGKLQVLNDEEYSNQKSRETWSKIQDILKADGRNMNEI